MEAPVPYQNGKSRYPSVQNITWLTSRKDGGLVREARLCSKEDQLCIRDWPTINSSRVERPLVGLSRKFEEGWRLRCRSLHGSKGAAALQPQMDEPPLHVWYGFWHAGILPKTYNYQEKRLCFTS
ncbi:hypothetical protein AVEN_83068-1 [Araneus ventricosus]|uniref:Uncharacterized protein n=1 Tax=Araneus ventricosus TaxID=182803 RepID=A0A4Y2AP22_ARAVE|nr:hypothetical protein AVEN_83068-1 [Araneus ventricosus]